MSDCSERMQPLQARCNEPMDKYLDVSVKFGRFIDAEEKTIHRLRLGKHREIPIIVERRGTGELSGRFEDMDLEGIDAEICLPQTGSTALCHR